MISGRVLIIDSEKGTSLKIEYMPTDFNGWFNVFDQKPREERQESQSQGGADMGDDGAYVFPEASPDACPHPRVNVQP